MKLLSLLIVLSIFFSACGSVQNTAPGSTVLTYPPATITESSQKEAKPSQTESVVQEQSSEILSEESEPVKIQITVGDITFIAVPEENSTEAFLALLHEQPLTVQMSDYAGME